MESCSETSNTAAPMGPLEATSTQTEPQSKKIKLDEEPVTEQQVTQQQVAEQEVAKLQVTDEEQCQLTVVESQEEKKDKKQKFSKSQTLLLIAEVKKHPCVYKRGTKEWRERNEAFDIIAANLGLPVDEVKRKWRNLREGFSRAISGLRSGTPTNFKYFEELSFLEPVVKSKTPQSVKDAKLPINCDEDNSIAAFVKEKILTPSGGAAQSELLAESDSSPALVISQPSCTSKALTLASNSKQIVTVSLRTSIDSCSVSPSSQSQHCTQQRKTSKTLQHTVFSPAASSNAQSRNVSVGETSVTLQETSDTSLPKNLNSSASFQSICVAPPVINKCALPQSTDMTSSLSILPSSCADGKTLSQSQAVTIVPVLTKKVCNASGSLTAQQFSNSSNEQAINESHSKAIKPLLPPSNTENVSCSSLPCISISPISSNIATISSTVVLSQQSCNPSQTTAATEVNSPSTPVHNSSHSQPNIVSHYPSPHLPPEEVTNRIVCQQIGKAPIKPSSRSAVDQQIVNQVKINNSLEQSDSSYDLSSSESLDSVYSQESTKSGFQGNIVSTSLVQVPLSEDTCLIDNVCKSCGKLGRPANKCVGTMTDHEPSEEEDERITIKAMQDSIYKLAAIDLPLYVIEMLTAGGYTTIDMISNMTDDQVNKVETFLKTNGIMARLVPQREKKLYFHWFETEQFCLLPAHRLLLTQLIAKLRVHQHGAR